MPLSPLSSPSVASATRGYFRHIQVTYISSSTPACWSSTISSRSEDGEVDFKEEAKFGKHMMKGEVVIWENQVVVVVVTPPNQSAETFEGGDFIVNNKISLHLKTNPPLLEDPPNGQVEGQMGKVRPFRYLAFRYNLTLMPNMTGLGAVLIAGRGCLDGSVLGSDQLGPAQTRCREEQKYEPSNGHLKKTSTVIELLDVGTFEKTESERAAKVFEEMSQIKSNVSSVLPPLSQDLEKEEVTPIESSRTGKLPKAVGLTAKTAKNGYKLPHNEFVKTGSARPQPGALPLGLRRRLPPRTPLSGATAPEPLQYASIRTNSNKCALCTIRTCSMFIRKHFVAKVNPITLKSYW
ncbi:hypothetical protein LXL04_031292 [Taraxacum kok-saghyz]